LVSGVEGTGIAVIDPLYTLWLSFKNILPGLVAAIIVLIIGYFIALIIGHVVRIILEKVGIDSKLRKARLTKLLGHTHLPNIFGEITKWYIFIIFLQVAVDLLALGTLTILLQKFVLWLPNVIAAILIFLFGLAIANYVEIKITENSKLRGSVLASQILKIAIIIIIIVIALKQIGIQVSLLENLILIIVGALAVGVALALGIGVGLGMQKSSQGWIENFKRKYL